MLDQDRVKSLQLRVEDYLRVSTTGYEVEELGDASTEALLAELAEAERQMDVLQARISRLRSMLVTTNQPPTGEG